jgi:hypothetical protein
MLLQFLYCNTMSGTNKQKVNKTRERKSPKTPGEKQVERAPGMFRHLPDTRTPRKGIVYVGFQCLRVPPEWWGSDHCPGRHLLEKDPVGRDMQSDVTTGAGELPRDRVNIRWGLETRRHATLASRLRALGATPDMLNVAEVKNKVS